MKEINKIKFHSFHSANKNNMQYKPAPVKNHIPKWFLEKDKFRKNADGSYQIVSFVKNGETINHKYPTWKSCPALLDVFTSGYYLLTPCDIEVVDNKKNSDSDAPLLLNFSDEWKNPEFGPPICQPRGIEDGLPYPEEYHNYTYTWILNWFTQVPEGYTVFFTHPINIENLPFKTISGFIDSANILLGTGRFPFYVKKNWKGIIPAGTPFAQVIPMKNESWESEIVEHTVEEMFSMRKQMQEEYRVGNALTPYKDLDWLKKHYE